MGEADSATLLLSYCRYDMILAAKGLGEDRLTNPHFTFHSSYKNLYHHMKPGKVGSRAVQRASEGLRDSMRVP